MVVAGRLGFCRVERAGSLGSGPGVSSIIFLKSSEELSVTSSVCLVEVARVWASAVALYVRWPLASIISYVRVAVWALAAPLPSQLPDNRPGAACGQ